MIKVVLLPHPFRLATLPLLAAAGVVLAQPLRAADSFAEIIRSTDPRSPAEEARAFHLPPGFEARLFASEPQISKPINLAFDEKGRLWMTESSEYPFAAAPGKKGRDTIKVLEDTDGDGKADSITTFAEGLNIPVGLYPYQDGVIAFSIPNITFFQDTDGDGKSDKETVLYGPFGFEKDTHGMTSAFRRGYDGWLYACHGFNNTTTLKGRDGDSITLNSGNTYRMRLDGSRVEQYTWGQVNPFGLAFDPLGNLYSADCHSSPIYQLLRGAHYPSFGKPHDGLGFAPTMMNHNHGSTAIGGIVYYDSDQFPQSFRNNFFVGNVMTCRINRDSAEVHGTTRLAHEEPDFLSCDDPWFRPVDLQISPEGALFVADFYNRIIGHYEVPLDHPGRDRERGRIWKIVYTGTGAPPPAETAVAGQRDWTKATPAEQIKALGHSNQTVRLLVMNWLTDHAAPQTDSALRQLFPKGSNPRQKVHALWVLERHGALDELTLMAAVGDVDVEVRTHAMRVLSERAPSPARLRLVLAGLQDAEPVVQRAAADAAGQLKGLPDESLLKEVLALRLRVPAEDTHLLHTVRMSLRNLLQASEDGKTGFSLLARQTLSERKARAVADVAVGIASPDSGAFLLGHLRMINEDRDTSARYLRHAARYATEKDLGGLAEFARSRYGNDLDFQLALFQSMQDGMAQRGSAAPVQVTEWGGSLAKKLLGDMQPGGQAWVNYPLDGLPASANPWFLQKRASADGDKESVFLCSLPPGGEALTGILRSRVFSLPATLSFFLAGHNGNPSAQPARKNFVRLRDAATHVVLREALPPRNDQAQAVTWDLQPLAGKQGYLEVVDGDTGSAYAWLALGRLKPAVVELPMVDPSRSGQRLQQAAEMVRQLKLAALEPEVKTALATCRDAEARVALARALLAINPAAHQPAVGQMVNDTAETVVVRERLAQALLELGSPAATAEVLRALRAAPQRAQVRLAQALAGTPTGAEALLRTVEDRSVSPRVLLERPVQDRLNATQPRDLKTRLAKLTAQVEPLDAEREKLIDQRRSGFASGSAQTGATLFTQNCAVCHQLGGQGGLVGPQLDGVGARGSDRLLEDILDPNRNVDAAFRTSTLILQDGDVASGLFRREEGEMVVLAESTGKEISIPKKSIKERRETGSSLMPENFGELLSAPDMNHLITYLLTQRPPAEKKAEK